jgi:predicted naringenin-chalcone synthase
MRITPPLLIADFHAIRPAHVVEQTASFAWLAAAHTEAESRRAHAAGEPFEGPRFFERMRRHIARFGCGADRIATRGHEIGDCAHTRWDEMEIYRFDRPGHPEGGGMLARTQRYARAADGIFARFYAEEDRPPSDLVHVTCTGYVSPSAAQKLVARRGWGSATRVTHAYHMGCYASLPALRIGGGFRALGAGLRSPGERTDVVHTEMCSLHMNPLRHEPEQLVVQTLFADGFIRYGIVAAPSWKGGGPALEILALHEAIVPDSEGSMSWIASDWGMEMTLARDVPDRVAVVLSAFVDRLFAHAGLSAADERGGALFAVHPGGPRIVDRVKEGLALDEAQIAHSRRVLREIGNVSSATLPHVWMAIAHARDIAPGRLVVSLAFGPGLTVCGAIFRKV